MNNGKTAKEFRKLLTEQEIIGPAQDALIRDTAKLRHEWRIEQTIDASFKHTEIALKYGGEYHRICALLILIADYIGIGGRDGVEGAATVRMDPFNKLGKGRRGASDGAAWMAAAQAAIYSKTFEAETGITLSARIENDCDLFLIAKTEQQHSFAISENLFAEAFLRSLLRHLLRKQFQLEHDKILLKVIPGEHIGDAYNLLEGSSIKRKLRGINTELILTREDIDKSCTEFNVSEEEITNFYHSFNDRNPPTIANIAEKVHVSGCIIQRQIFDRFIERWNDFDYSH